jgi:hypothetical protein
MALVKDTFLARIDDRNLTARLVPRAQLLRRDPARRSYHRILHALSPLCRHTGESRCLWLK